MERRAGTLAASSPGRLCGYASVFSSESKDLGGFVEVVKPGAFSRSLASGKNVRALWQHNGDALLGTTNARTLRLQEDARGLHFECVLPDTGPGRDLSVLVSRGDVAGCSFGFMVNSDRWEKRGSGWLRELIDVDLAEITMTDSPAYVDTTVALRSLATAERVGSPLYLWLETVR